MDFSLVSAVRVGEICRIAFEDVDWANHTVTIRNRKGSKQRIGNNQVAPLLLAAMNTARARAM